MRFSVTLMNFFGEQTTLSPETQEASSHQPSPQEENLEPPKKRISLSPGEMLGEKEAEVARLQDEVCVCVGGGSIVLGAFIPNVSLPTTPSLCSRIPPLPGLAFYPNKLVVMLQEPACMPPLTGRLPGLHSP